MKRTSKIWLLLAALLFVGLFIASPLMHNHPHTMIEPDTCPANILQSNLLACAFCLSFLFLVFVPRFDTDSTDFLRPAYTPFTGFVLVNKAPPIS